MVISFSVSAFLSPIVSLDLQFFTFSDEFHLAIDGPFLTWYHSLTDPGIVYSSAVAPTIEFFFSQVVATVDFIIFLQFSLANVFVNNCLLDMLLPADERITTFIQILENECTNEFTLEAALQIVFENCNSGFICILHGYMDNILQNSLIGAYAKFGILSYAVKLLERLSSRDVVAWTSIISGHVIRGSMHEALMSSISVLDSSFYKKKSSISLVKKGSIDFKEHDTWSFSVISSDESKSEDKLDVCDFIYTSDSSRTEGSFGTSDRKEALTLPIQVERYKASTLPIQVEWNEASALPIQVKRKDVAHFRFKCSSFHQEAHQVADGFTKPLAKATFEVFREKIGFHGCSTSEEQKKKNKVVRSFLKLLVVVRVVSINCEEVNQQARCIELAKSSSFYSAVYSETEEIGWEHLVRVGGDLNFLIFRVLDTKGRVRVLEIELDKAYPKVPPMVSADVPYIFNLEWTMNSRLKNLNLGVLLPIQHLEKLQGFWSTLEEIDRSLQIVDLKQASRAIVSRQIQVGNDCSMILSININDPRSLPECRLMGSGIVVNSLRKTWKKNVDKWVKDIAFLENLECLMNTQLPRLADEEKNNRLDECGICYARYLPIGDEHRPNSGNATDYTCENNSCSKAFHTMCLVDWLRSITTTRQYVEL
ncbi:hypothetical protein F3Y22_tig00110813pilonHSYRG00293 [Hibiscus syriacus]|uniref:Uncharacterized protein n=1 Tax=Hibiscus syriacus TaxID=106335 RepID=A0A6A2ZND0_HIBSY|nr:hypothetical protein F3Y22_tig00110813pilonHSYRG00293 [Hibiscus syriacus]